MGLLGIVPRQYGYSGREPDQTGLTYFRARYQHPGLGRFLSRDPAGMADAVSPYAYVRNNPVGYVDPMGWLASDPVMLAQTSGLGQYWGAIGDTMTDIGSVNSRGQTTDTRNE